MAQCPHCGKEVDVGLLLEAELGEIAEPSEAEVLHIKEQLGIDPSTVAQHVALELAKRGIGATPNEVALVVELFSTFMNEQIDKFMDEQGL